MVGWYLYGKNCKTEIKSENSCETITFSKWKPGYAEVPKGTDNSEKVHMRHFNLRYVDFNERHLKSSK